MTIAPKTALEAFNGKGVSIAVMRKESSEVVTTAFLTYIVTELIQSFNVGKTMNDMQAVFVVNGIMADYFFLKPEELKYCFEQAKKGRYGTMYDRIDASVIFEWIEKYLIERTELAIQKNIEESKSFNANSDTIHPKYAEKLKEIFKDKKEDPPEQKKEIKRERTEEEKIVQDIFKEFDTAHQKKIPDPNEVFRMIEYKGKKVTQDDYLVMRLIESGLMKKRYKDYKYQIINFTDKKIIYTDDKSKYLTIIGKTLEINDILFRKKITHEYKTFKIIIE